ncbi:MAG TPA: shikimate dehydrogenase, partial [Legionellales bacterium]|nr:shikimate dehydrogenase [Legionellales bacterium]
TRAYQLSDCPTPRCQEAQAANTLWCKDHKIYADNTDGIGLVRDLRRIMPLAHKRILIVGAGGAALGIIPALYQAQVQHIEVHNRSAARLQALLAQFPQVNIKPVDPITSKVDLIINATSSQNTAFTSLNQAFKDKPPCYDLSYDLHHPTYFVQHAKAQRCVAYDGLGMLIEQAAESFWRWHGVKPDTTAMSHQLRLKKSLHLIAGR